MKKLAIIGASYLQEPLIQKAKDMGIETHVFAWETGDIGEKIADYFYPISIVEKEEILGVCQEIGIDGICTIASDLAVITVNYVANALGLVGNTNRSTELSTNKNCMRKAFESNNDPSPKSVLVRDEEDLREVALEYPIIVKPLDRSGSRGITKLETPTNIQDAINHAIEESFLDCALVEEFATGREYSVEYISWEGKHHFLALTEKATTGSPCFIETGHIEPVQVCEELSGRIKQVVEHALDSLEIKYGASHSEIKISSDNEIKIIEIGGRMGGDFIGSRLVEESTGIDFVEAVIKVAMGHEPDLAPKKKGKAVGIKYILSQDDIYLYNKIKQSCPQLIIQSDVPSKAEGNIKDSSTRLGYFIVSSEDVEDIRKYII